jgi:HD superfamily phosphohydrolase
MDAIELLDRLEQGRRFRALVQRIEEEVLRTPVSAYLERRKLEGTPAPKAIKDAVWGMVDIYPPELIVLDSPPLQRLRHIRQLGVTYLTYPTAAHSRFEHTIGAIYQAERMLRAIAARSSASEEILRNLSTVRLAALLHDIGHLPFSHVSERFYAARECSDVALLNELTELTAEVQNTLQVGCPKLSECLSLAMALTPSFGELLGPSPGANYQRRTIAHAILSIVGRPPSLNEAFLAQVITNIIDADKLDYMFRDAHATGVPLAVDLERLLFKLRCLEIPRERCPRHLQEIVGHDGNVRVLGTDLAGERHAHDLALSRTMLFRRVYHHHKTLAAERIVLEVLHNLRRHPAELLREDDRLFSRYSADRHPADNHRLLSMLDLRDLPRRVFAISYGFLPALAPTSSDAQPKPTDEQKEAWTRLLRRVADPGNRGSLRQEIWQTAAEIASLLYLTRTIAIRSRTSGS